MKLRLGEFIRQQRERLAKFEAEYMAMHLDSPVSCPMELEQSDWLAEFMDHVSPDYFTTGIHMNRHVSQRRTEDEGD